MKELLQRLIDDAERASSKLNFASVEVSALKARMIIALRDLEGRPNSRDARLARCLITEPFDDALYTAISAEPVDPPINGSATEPLPGLNAVADALAVF